MLASSLVSNDLESLKIMYVQAHLSFTTRSPAVAEPADRTSRLFRHIAVYDVRYSGIAITVYNPVSISNTKCVLF